MVQMQLATLSSQADALCDTLGRDAEHCDTEDGEVEKQLSLLRSSLASLSSEAAANAAAQADELGPRAGTGGGSQEEDPRNGTKDIGHVQRYARSIFKAAK